MTRIAVVDYDMGNLRLATQTPMAVASEADVRISTQADEIRAADRVVLSGQSAMPDCMATFDQSGLRDTVLGTSRSKPMFGVCVSEQMLLERSTEARPGQQYTEGLGLIKDDVVRLDLDNKLQPDGSQYKVPQMGWSRVYQSRAHTLWEGVSDQSYFCFVHSYYARLASTDESVGETEYGVWLTSVIARDNIFATQSRPEKSAQTGLQIYQDFAYWNP